MAGDPQQERIAQVPGQRRVEIHLEGVQHNHGVDQVKQDIRHLLFALGTDQPGFLAEISGSHQKEHDADLAENSKS